MSADHKVIEISSNSWFQKHFMRLGVTILRLKVHYFNITLDLSERPLNLRIYWWRLRLQLNCFYDIHIYFYGTGFVLIVAYYFKNNLFKS